MTTIPGWSVVISPRIAADLPKTEVRHNLLPSKIDWKGQAFPFRIRQVELRQESDLSRYQLESTAHRILKPESTRIASTNYPSIRHFQQVAMNRREPCATKLASLFDRCGPAETSQGHCTQGTRSRAIRGGTRKGGATPDRAGSRPGARPYHQQWRITPFSRATPDRAGARPYHQQWRITPFSRTTSDRAGARPYHQQWRITPLRGPPRIAREHVPPAKADSPSLLVCGAGSLAAIVSEHMLQASVPSRLCETAYQDE